MAKKTAKNQTKTIDTTSIEAKKTTAPKRAKAPAPLKESVEEPKPAKAMKSAEVEATAEPAKKQGKAEKPSKAKIAPVAAPGYVARVIPPGAIKVSLPHVVQQTGYTCGQAALASIRGYFGVGRCEEESQLLEDMKIADDNEAGSDPADIIGALGELKHDEKRKMSDAALRKALDRKHPVMVMLQAWGDPKPPTYDGWSDGHWLVAIGYDKVGVYFEDPSLYCRRGFMSWKELDKRWHDIEGDDNRAAKRLGIEIWKDDVTESQFDKTAIVIE